MSFNGSGTFVINSSGQPVVANTVISSTVFNALTADLATGLSTCITKDGQTTPTANIPMGTFKFTNLGNGSAATDSATLGQVQASTTKLVTVTGTDTITGTMTPALTAYASGQMFYFVAGGANTGAVTLNIDGLGARNVTRHGSVALVAGDILSGEVCVVVYDGTRFQLLNPASYTNLNVTGVLSLAAGTALLPSLAFSGDPNTGLWSPAADTLAASTGGSERLRVDSSGNLGIGTSSPGARLHTNKASQTPGDVTPSGAFLVTNTSAGAGCVEIGSGSSVLGYLQVRNSASQTYYDFALQPNGGNVGIGTSSPGKNLEVAAATDTTIRIRNTTTTLSSAVFGTLDWATSDTSAPGGIVAKIDTFDDFPGGGGFGDRAAVRFFTNNGTALAERARITSAGSFVAGAQAALATTATDGFLYVPTCAGTPTGTPTAITGLAPIVVDTTNNKLYFYSGGQWRDAGP